jgi:tRNA(Phe) wybutosine-synthesizing methylase Tyw3
VAKKTAPQPEVPVSQAAVPTSGTGNGGVIHGGPVQVLVDADTAQDMRATVLTSGRGQVILSSDAYCVGLTMSLETAKRFANGMLALLGKIEAKLEAKERK